MCHFCLWKSILFKMFVFISKVQRGKKDLCSCAAVSLWLLRHRSSSKNRTLQTAVFERSTLKYEGCKWMGLGSKAVCFWTILTKNESLKVCMPWWCENAGCMAVESDMNETDKPGQFICRWLSCWNQVHHCWIDSIADHFVNGFDGACNSGCFSVLFSYTRACSVSGDRVLQEHKWKQPHKIVLLTTFLCFSW